MKIMLKSKPRVLIITSSGGGLAHYTCHLQEYLKKYCKLYFVTYKKNYINGDPINKLEDDLIAENIRNPYYLLEHDSPSSLFDVIHLVKKLEIKLVDIQFCTTAMPVVFYYSLLTKKLKELGVPVVLTCHDVLQHTLQNHRIESLRLLYDETEHFIVGNKSEFRKLTHYFPIAKSRVTIIEHGVYNKFDKGKFTEESARKHLKLTNKKVILFFGFLRKYKGILTLVDAMKFVAEKEKNAVLYLAGSSNVEDIVGEIKIRIKANNLFKNVKLSNEYIDINGIEALYKASDVVALPYINISQSGVLCMSWYFKKPVVVTDIFPEAPLIDRKMGMVVKKNNPKQLADALLFLLQNEDLAQKYGEKGYEYVQKHRSWEKIAKKTFSIFSRYIEK